MNQHIHLAARFVFLVAWSFASLLEVILVPSALPPLPVLMRLYHGGEAPLGLRRQPQRTLMFR